MMISWIYVPSLIMIGQRSAEKLANSYLAALRSNLIGCRRYFREIFIFFVKHGLKIKCAKFRDDWTKCVIGDTF